MSMTKGGLATIQHMPTVRTALRIKPTNELRRRRTVPVRGQAGTYVVDLSLSDSATQQQAYQHVAAPLVDAFVHGENAVLLVYGASATGKTYTLQGSGSSQDAGVIQQAVQAVHRGLSIVPKQKYRLRATHCGLSIGHDAQLLDLLAPASAAAVASLRDGSAASALAGLTSWTIEEPADIIEVFRCRRLHASAFGRGARGFHTMLTLQLDSYATDKTLLSSNQLTFVELAAPEPKDPLGIGRSSNDNANARSLAMAFSSLSKVLTALRHSAAAPAAVTTQGMPAAAAALAVGGMGGQQHVPWRDSPLTRWLQERLHAASAITLLGTVSASTECAADSLATISWVSRFSSASKSGAGGLLVTFSWDVVAAPEAVGGLYIRFHPEQDVIQSYGEPATEQRQNAGCSSPQRAGLATVGQINSFCAPACSSPMVNQCSPNLNGAGSPNRRPPSAASVHNMLKQPSWWQPLLQQSPDSTPVTKHVQQWQQQQEILQQHNNEQTQQQPGSPGQDISTAAGNNALTDEVLLFGELMTVLKRAGGGLRAEAILEQLLQDLGAARASLSAERGETHVLRNALASLQEDHRECQAANQQLQERFQVTQRQLEVAQASLQEVTSDRDMFLRRLQQLEAEADGTAVPRPSSRLEMQRNKAQTEQIRLMEAELNALVASNQQLRTQLDLTVQQLSKTAAEKVAAQEAAEDDSERLQQELDVLRSAAEIDGDIRKELEASVAQLRRACEASAREVAAVSAERAALRQQYEEAQISIDALAAELQDTITRADSAEATANDLKQQLQDAQQDCSSAQQQVAALQAQVSALEEMTQQLLQQQEQAAENINRHGQNISMLQGLLQDLCHVLEDFEVDVESALPSQWRQLLGSPMSPRKSSISTQDSLGSKLRCRLLGLVDANSTQSAAPTAGDTAALNGALPVLWVHKLEAMLRVLRLAVQERNKTVEELSSALKKTELLESNVTELRKLVSTQEDLQEQLATQLAASQAEAETAAQTHAAQQSTLQQQLTDAQATVAALAEELQDCQSSLTTAQQNASDRDQAIDALADELVELHGSQEQLEANRLQAEEQVVALAAELEETQLQLRLRDQVLDQVWSQLKGTNNSSNASHGNDTATNGTFAEDSWQGGHAPLRSKLVDHVKQQQWQRQQHCEGLLQRHGILSGGGSGNSLAQQAVREARRRSSLSSEQSRDRSSNDGSTAEGLRRGTAVKLNSSIRRQQSGQLLHAYGTSEPGEEQCHGSTAQQKHQQVQPLVVDAVRRLRNQAGTLQQQLAEAYSGSRDSDAVVAKLQQRLSGVRNQNDQLVCQVDELQQEKQHLQSKCRMLTAQLQEKEAELEQAQDRCQQLLMSLKQVQQRLQQQQELQHLQSNDAAVSSTSTSQLQLQLIDCKRQLTEAQSALQEATAALSAEKAARIAAQDAEAGRQQLLDRIATLQADLADLHGQLLAEKKAAASVREELSLTNTSRDTWRDAAKRAEAAAAEAAATAEAKNTQLTRARAELLSVRDQLAAVTRALDAQQLQLLLEKGTDLASAAIADEVVSEGMAARLAAAQVMRREAEDRASQLEHKLAAAEAQLAKLQQQQGESDQAASELGGQLSVTAAQLARIKAEAAAHRAAAEGGVLQLTAMDAKLQEAQGRLAVALAERDTLQQQLAALTSCNDKAATGGTWAAASVCPDEPAKQQELQPGQQPQGETGVLDVLCTAGVEPTYASLVRPVYWGSANGAADNISNTEQESRVQHSRLHKHILAANLGAMPGTPGNSSPGSPPRAVKHLLTGTFSNVRRILSSDGGASSFAAGIDRIDDTTTSGLMQSSKCATADSEQLTQGGAEAPCMH